MRDELERSQKLGITRFVHDIGRFVNLAVEQGTRLMDVLERHAIAAERYAEATERIADGIGGRSKDGEVDKPDGAGR